PFWPSFEPCAKLTPPQVDSSTARIHFGGLSPCTGGRYSAGFRIVFFATSNNTAAATNPMIGEINSDNPTSKAFVQLIPDRSCRVIMLFAKPTPRIDPMSVCELDTGNPYHHVPRFQIIAANNNDSTITIDRTDELSVNKSTGSKLTIANATAVPPSSTPK